MMALNSTFSGFQQYLMAAAALIAVIVADERMSGGRVPDQRTFPETEFLSQKYFKILELNTYGKPIE